MNIEQLQKLFSDLPDELMNHFGENNFKTCWYGSSNLDKRPMIYADNMRQNTDFGDSIDVFFYTDIDFFVMNQELYSCYHRGRVVFNNTAVNNYDPEIEKMEGTFYRSIENYILVGEIIKSDVVLQKNGIFPTSSDANGFNLGFFYDKLELQAKYLALDRIKQNYIEHPLTPEELDALNYMREVGLCNHPFDEIPQNLITRANDFDFAAYENRAVIVKHFRNNGDPFYTFYIDVDDHSFEQILLDKQLNIDYAAKSNGWAGPGPSEQYKDQLGWQWLEWT